MSIMDLKLELSDKQAITGSATYRESTNTIDLGAASISLGAGTPLYLNIRVNEGVVSGWTGATTDTVTFRLQSDTGVNFVTPKTVWSAQTVAIATLAAGYWVARLSLPYELTERHIRLLYSNSCATDFTTGSFDAWISSATPETNI